VRIKPYTAEDMRFTTKGDALYAILLGWPADKTAIVKSLATSSPKIAGRKVSDVTLLGYSGKLTWTQDEAGLHVQLPGTARANTPSPEDHRRDGYLERFKLKCGRERERSCERQRVDGSSTCWRSRLHFF